MILSLRRRSPVAVAAALLVLTGCSAGPELEPAALQAPTASAAAPVSAAPSTSAPVAGPAAPAASPAALTGTRGAVDFDAGTVRIGDGPKTVDLYLDPLCPYCRVFEQGSGPLLFDEASAGRATVLVHPLAVLDRLSLGTRYSTRASAAFVAVSAAEPSAAQAFLQALFERQPAEGSAGLTDDDLAAMALAVGVDDLEAEADLDAYRGWVAERTQEARTGPLSATTSIPAIEHVPTVVVDGRVFDAGSDESAAFATFYAG